MNSKKAIIDVQNLSKIFKVENAESTLTKTFTSLLKKDFKEKCAVDDISFSVNEGDFVGYLGPNGAGKSTTIKMLTGILVPTNGSIYINGVTPYKDRINHCKQIGVVFGQRTQLWWDLPPIAAFELLGKIYKIENKKLKSQIEFFTETLKLEEFLNIQVRKLSLGQRMRCELTAALLHEPKLLFLDEPTIGLDINAKEAIRNFLKQINNEKKTTILLTTHDLSDVEELCKRVMVINNGKIIHDSNVKDLKIKFGNFRQAIFDLESEYNLALPEGSREIDREGKRISIEFNCDKIKTPELISAVSNQTAINDISIKEISIESVVKRIYNTKY